MLKELARIYDEDGQKQRAKEVHEDILRYSPEDADSLAYINPSASNPGKAPSARVSVGSRVGPPQRPPRAITLGSYGKSPSNATGAVPLDRPDDHPGEATATSVRVPVAPKAKSIRPARQPSTQLGSNPKSETLAADISLDEDVTFADNEGTLAGELHEQEIVKILAETDVYVKYGLHQKAADHLQGVFALDPDNIEAREQLKDVYLSQGRRDDAVRELMHLARQLAPIDPGQAEAWLKDLLALNGTYQPAFLLAEQHDLHIPGHTAGTQGSDGGVVIVDESEDLPSDPSWNISDSSASRSMPFDNAQHLDVDVEALEEFDLDELSAELLSPGDFTGEISQVGSGDYPRRPTQEIMPEQIDDIESVTGVSGAGLTGFDVDLEPTNFPPNPTSDIEEETFGHLARDPLVADDPLLVGEPLLTDEPLTDTALVAGDPLHHSQKLDQVAQELGVGPIGTNRLDSGFDLPGDEELTAAVWPKQEPSGPQRAQSEWTLESSFGSSSPLIDAFTAAPTAAPAPDEPVETEFPPLDLIDNGSPVRDSIPGPEFAPTPEATAEPEFVAPGIAFAARGPEFVPETVVQPELEPELADLEPEAVAPDPQPQLALEPEANFANSSSSVKDSSFVDDSVFEDELDEVEFYASQGLFEEAVETLEELLKTYPDHPSLVAKLDALRKEHSADAGATEQGVESAPVPSRAPQVMLEEPIDDEDADSHYDLGLAYREMGLHGEAMQAFEKVLNVSGRRIQSRLMLGLCHRDQGNTDEAIDYFEQALSVPEISDLEKIGFYYELGLTYEAMNKPTDAKRFYTLVTNQDREFRDVLQRIAQLK